MLNGVIQNTDNFDIKIDFKNIHLCQNELTDIFLIRGRYKIYTLLMKGETRKICKR